MRAMQPTENTRYTTGYWATHSLAAVRGPQTHGTRSHTLQLRVQNSPPPSLGTPRLTQTLKSIHVFCSVLCCDPRTSLHGGALT
jgi:hypothetical protein